MFRIAICSFLVGTHVVFAAIDLNRELILAPQPGTAREDLEIARWQARAGTASARGEDFERLGWAYVAKARRTLDAGYYKLAEKTADVAEAQFGARAEFLLLRGHVLHNLHHFAAAEKIAAQLVAARGTPADFALLSDVLVEQGKLEAAVEALQRLVQLKPGTEALTRIAHLRWLKGDLSGAMAAMRQSLEATAPGDRGTCAWILTRIAGYSLQAGDTVRAYAAAARALVLESDFAPAVLALGRVQLAQGKSGDAIASLTRAADLNSAPEYQWWLADALRAVGRDDDAERVESLLSTRGAREDPRTFSLFLSTRSRDARTAAKLAREELRNRRDVHTHDALAWALANAGEFESAAVEMRAALAEHTDDPRLFLHAGIIAQATPGLGDAAEFFTRARMGAAALTPSERALLPGNGNGRGAGGAAPVNEQ